MKTMGEIMKSFLYGSDHLDIAMLEAISKSRVKGTLDRATSDRVVVSAQWVEQLALGDDPVYGINTGFGPLCTTKVSPQETKELQRNILISHAVGVGDPIDLDLACKMMILKVHNLAKGHSGIQLGTLERIMWHIEQGIIPHVPAKGSVGASGDLAPLSHLFLPLIGEGKVFYKNDWVPCLEMLSAEGLEPIELQAKEGLALINGTQFMAAHGADICQRLSNLVEHADLIGAITLDALQGSIKPFYHQIHDLRPHQGSKQSASRVYDLLQGSKILQEHANCSRVQDPYSLRCMPQVHGAVRNALAHLLEKIEIEMNSVTDNPILIDDQLVISGGNFHGELIAMPMDYACLAASELGNISDRRIYLSLEGKYDGVPKLLMTETGTNSGFMILQYTSAALASENKSLCFPASADSIPTSLGQEDHVSMGSISGRKAIEVLKNTEHILAIELLCATQALEFRKPSLSSDVIERVYDRVRQEIPFFTKDEVFYPFIEKARRFIAGGELLELSEIKISTDA